MVKKSVGRAMVLHYAHHPRYYHAHYMKGNLSQRDTLPPILGEANPSYTTAVWRISIGLRFLLFSVFFCFMNNSAVHGNLSLTTGVAAANILVMCIKAYFSSLVHHVRITALNLSSKLLCLCHSS